ncbi:MAG: hypothetical protein P4L81_00250 [Candidatus Pacebacteria bacterium]|nr:hypothetical protein [Candidatus Paceibacterota bacterium]
MSAPSKRYSPFFSTVYDETAPRKDHRTIGRGGHFSVLQAVYPEAAGELAGRGFRFIVIWDEDHDRRVIEIAEELFRRKVMHLFYAIGERKASVSLILPPGATMGQQHPKWLEDLPPFDDTFNVFVRTDDTEGIMQTSAKDVQQALHELQQACTIHGLQVMSPDINASYATFTTSASELYDEESRRLRAEEEAHEEPSPEEHDVDEPEQASEPERDFEQELEEEPEGPDCLEQR